MNCEFLKKVAAVEAERKNQSYEQLVPIKGVRIFCITCGQFKTAVWRVIRSKEEGYREIIAIDKCPQKT